MIFKTVEKRKSYVNGIDLGNLFGVCIDLHRFITETHIFPMKVSICRKHKYVQRKCTRERYKANYATLPPLCHHVSETQGLTCISCNVLMHHKHCEDKTARLQAVKKTAASLLELLTLRKKPNPVLNSDDLISNCYLS